MLEPGHRPGREGADQPQRRGKAPFRNVSIANADSQGFAYFHSAVQEGYRAVQDLP